LNRIKKRDGDVIQLVIDEGLDIIELEMRKLSSDTQQGNCDQRFSVLESNVNAILRSQYAGINIASAEYGARYVEPEKMGDDSVDAEQIVSWFDGVPVVANATSSRTFNFSMDSEREFAISAPLIIKLAKPYVINVVSLTMNVSWYSKKESADQYALAENQTISIDIEVSLDGIHWAQAGHRIESVPARYNRQLHKKGNAFLVRYRSDVILNEDHESRFIRVFVKRKIREFAIILTDFVSSDAWSDSAGAICGLCSYYSEIDSSPPSISRSCIQKEKQNYGTRYECPPKDYLDCQQRDPKAPLVNPLIPKEWKEAQCVTARLPVALSSISAMYLLKGQYTPV